MVNEAYRRDRNVTTDYRVVVTSPYAQIAFSASCLARNGVRRALFLVQPAAL